jgi:hypothetical protein
MSRLARRLLILLAGPVGLTVATAAPALAAGLNHTEPFTTVGRATARTSASSQSDGIVGGRGA